MKNARLVIMLLVLVVFAGFISGCTENVPGGMVGRIKTADGWAKEIHPTGKPSCWGRDEMYLLDVTSKTFVEKAQILIGGKTNLTVDYSVRVRANSASPDELTKAFERIAATKTDKGSYTISVDQMYNTFIKMHAQSIPRSVFEIQPDGATALANSASLAAEVKKQMMAAGKTTPLVVEDFQITNYDWPKSITDAQELLQAAKLKEATADAENNADLKKAKGRLAVEEANKLVDFKKAEAIAGSIDIIKKKLAASPEYLMWHQIEVMGEAAKGPNNTFVMYPYQTDMSQVRGMLNNAQMSQLKKDKEPVEKPAAKK